MGAEPAHESKEYHGILTEYLTKTPAIHIEEGLGLRLGGELELGRVGYQPPDLPLKVQFRVARRLERKQNQ